MISNRINSEALATMGSRPIVVTAVTFPSFPWYEANFHQLCIYEHICRNTYLELRGITIGVDIIEACSGSNVSQTFTDGRPEDWYFLVLNLLIWLGDVVSNFSALLY
jgi:hypothetical protein